MACAGVPIFGLGRMVATRRDAAHPIFAIVHVYTQVCLMYLYKTAPMHRCLQVSPARHPIVWRPRVQSCFLTYSLHGCECFGARKHWSSAAPPLLSFCVRFPTRQHQAGHVHKSSSHVKLDAIQLSASARHAFYDLRGVKYYYNFETQESKTWNSVLARDETCSKMVPHSIQRAILLLLSHAVCTVWKTFLRFLLASEEKEKQKVTAWNMWIASSSALKRRSP